MKQEENQDENSLKTDLKYIRKTLDEIKVVLNGPDGRSGLVADVNQLKNCDATKERFFDKYAPFVYTFVGAILGSGILVVATWH